MIFPLFRRNRRVNTISALYGTIVAQARLPCFYQDFAVADTINGRFDLLVLHLALVTGRLMSKEPLKELGQGLFDHFCQDMDDNLREIGIADMKVPKEMRRMGEAFYGRAQAYETALAEADDDGLIAALTRNVYAGALPAPSAARLLAAYMREARGMLNAQEDAAFERGKIRFPDPIESFARA